MLKEKTLALKQIIFSVLLVVFSSFSGIYLHAQTLQFSQVMLVSSSETVPAGKVWKLEGVNYSASLPNTAKTTSSSITTVNFDATISLNGQSVPALSMRSRAVSSSSSNLIWEKSWPIWIPAGTTLAPGTNVLSISVIEFTVVP
jgi:hypothetical protein